MRTITEIPKEDAMNIYKVSANAYYLLSKKLAGSIFHRIDSDGNYLLKPTKSVDHIVKTFAV